MFKVPKNIILTLALAAGAFTASIFMWWWHYAEEMSDPRGAEVRASGVLESFSCEIRCGGGVVRLNPGQCGEVNGLLVDLLSRKGNADHVELGGFAPLVGFRYQRLTEKGDWETVFEIESWRFAVAVHDRERHETRWYCEVESLDERIMAIGTQVVEERD